MRQDETDIDTAINRLRGQLHIYRDEMDSESATRRIRDVIDNALAGIRERAAKAIAAGAQANRQIAEVNRAATKLSIEVAAQTKSMTAELKSITAERDRLLQRLELIRLHARDERKRVAGTDLNVRRAPLNQIYKLARRDMEIGDAMHGD